jgi:peptide-methionine (S)-S-oxide reductase
MHGESESMTMRRVLAATAGVVVLTGVAVAAPAASSQGSARREGGPRKMKTGVSIPKGKEAATLAGGCFWCVEAIFEGLKGVETVTPGYAGGHVSSPTYKQVCGGDTGHAEAVRIIFDPTKVSYADLLRIFFTTHDPTTQDRQGADVGTQYRSAVFTHSQEQARIAKEVVAEIGKAKLYANPIVTEVTPFTSFYAAEEYHRDYFARNPEQAYCRAVIAPKVAKFRARYRDKLKK